MQKNFLVLLLAACLLFMSCKKEITPPALSETTSDLNLQQANRLRTDFSKVLAKAIANPQVQTLIKEEALKQFDNDYDILFQQIKDKEVGPGLKLIDYMSSLGLTAIMRDELGKTMPLLTIFVPEFSNFSAEKWDVNSKIPIVAVVNNDFSEKKHTPITAFDHTGNSVQLKSNKVPAMPVIVVKDNERVKAYTKSSETGKTIRDNYFFSNDSYDFFFADQVYNHQKTTTGKFMVGIRDGSLGNKSVEAFHNGAVSQRDYVYYSILNPGDQGPLNLGFGEYLTGIVFTPSSEYFLYDDQTSDWSDGAFEFQLDVLLFNGSSALNKISKVFPVPAQQRYFTNSETSWYKFPNPILIETWDMKKYGDTWKYILTELDPGTVTTISHSSSTKIGSNFSYNSSTGQENKVGTGFGSTVEQSFTSSIGIQITQGSDFCGEAVVNYMSPVVTGWNFVRGGSAEPKYYFAEANTGIARMLIYPKFIQ